MYSNHAFFFHSLVGCRFKSWQTDRFSNQRRTFCSVRDAVHRHRQTRRICASTVFVTKSTSRKGSRSKFICTFVETANVIFSLLESGSLHSLNLGSFWRYALRSSKAWTRFAWSMLALSGPSRTVEELKWSWRSRKRQVMMKTDQSTRKNLLN